MAQQSTAQRGPGRPRKDQTETPAGKKPTPGTVLHEAHVREVMKRIIHTPEYLGEFFGLMFTPENRSRLTDNPRYIAELFGIVLAPETRPHLIRWALEQRTAIEALLSGAGYKDEPGQSHSARA